MVVLITGANGFVGKHLQEELKEKYELIPAARKKVADMAMLDLRSDASIDLFIEEMGNRKADAIVHTAGRLVGGGMPLKEQMKVFEDNIRITKGIIKLVRKLDAKVLVNFSSIAVYPNEDGEYSETSMIKTSMNTDCMYGLSKFCAENMLDYSIGEKCRIVNLRLAQIYGRGMRSDRIIPVMRQSIMDSNSIEVFGNGERISNFVDVKEVCKAVDDVLRWEDAKGVYNIGRENITYLELAQRMKDRYGNSDTRIVLQDIGNKSKFILNTDKFANLRRMHGTTD